MSFIIKSGLRIFDTIKALLENPKNTDELQKILQQKGIFADKPLIAKYIATLRKAGFEIEYISGNMEIVKTPFNYEISKEAIKGFNTFLAVLSVFNEGKMKLRCNKLKYKFINLFKNIHLKEIKENDYCIQERTGEKILELIKFLNMDDEPVIQITVCKKQKKGHIKDLFFKKDGVYIIFFNIEEQILSEINLDKITNIKYISKNISKLNISPFINKTVFKITDNLMQNYNPKEGEIIEYKKDYILVSNAYENKDGLFIRLLKYGNNCEIIYPEADRKKFKKFLKKMLKHYNSI